MDGLNLLAHITPFAAACFGVGALLLLVEVIHPGFGIPGITGLFLLFLGVFISARTWSEVLAMTLIILGLAGIALSFILNSAKSGFIYKKIILKNTSLKESGYVAVEDFSCFMGQEGKSVTILRPSGTAEFDGIKVDVVTEGEFIPQDTPVQVTKVEGRRVIVRKIS